jgi:hypothetical protein
MNKKIQIADMDKLINMIMVTANSAGDTMAPREALALIRSLCTGYRAMRGFPSQRATAPKRETLEKLTGKN